MDGKGRALDNIVTERLWWSVKYEHVYLPDDSTPRAVRQGLEEYFTFYNYRRPNQALQYRTPAELYGRNRGCLNSESKNTENTGTVVAAPISSLAEIRQHQVSSIQFV